MIITKEILRTKKGICRYFIAYNDEQVGTQEVSIIYGSPLRRNDVFKVTASGKNFSQAVSNALSNVLGLTEMDTIAIKTLFNIPVITEAMSSHCLALQIAYQLAA